eukprot:SAG11_NODE_26337_length_346_cov_1.246964_1_plen_22_part_10
MRERTQRESRQEIMITEPSTMA